MTFEPGCLHCAVVEEIGRRLEAGAISGQQALDDLVAVMADVLATAPADQASEMLDAIIMELPAAEARSRERMKQEPSLERRHG